MIDVRWLMRDGQGTDIDAPRATTDGRALTISGRQRCRDTGVQAPHAAATPRAPQTG